MMEQVDSSLLSEKELIHWINNSERKVIQASEELVKKEFVQRGWNYQNLISSNKAASICLEQPLWVDQHVLFECEIPYPTQVGLFYKNRILPIQTFLSECRLLKEKELVTYSWIRDQLFLGKRITTISEGELLREQQVFVFLKQYGCLFPRYESIAPRLENNIKVVFDKGEQYRGIDKVVIYKNDSLVSSLVLNKKKS